MKNCRLAFAALTLTGVLVTTAAEARPDLRQMSCSQAQNMVRQHGAVVFHDGSVHLFDVRLKPQLL